MPKRKVSIKPKTIAKKSFPSLKNILTGVVLATLLIGGYFYTTMERSSINMIGSERGVYPTSTAVPRQCNEVKSLTYSGNCGPSSYQNISFTCVKGTTRPMRQGGTSSCKPYTTWYGYAQQACAKLCPSPSPTPIASLQPSPKPPVPSGTCTSSLKGISYGSSVGVCKTGTVQFAKYTCLDGYTGSLGDSSTCTATSEFEALAKGRCGSPHTCQTSTPYPSRTPYSSPTLIPVPTSL